MRLFVAQIGIITSLVNQAPTSIPKVYNHLSTSLPQVALTFDDGPDSYNTLRVLDILDKYQIKATFFMLGENVVRFPSVVKEVYNRGHHIGLHTYSHPNFKHMSYDAIKEEIVHNQKCIEKVISYKPTIIRPPYGMITDEFLNVARDLELTVYTWSKDSFDWKCDNTEKDIIHNVTNELYKGAIILMHDKSANQKHSRAALGSIIKYIQNKGFEFVVL